MEFLRQIHDFQFNSSWAFLFPTPYALITLILFLLSIWPAIIGRVGPAFLVALRLAWLMTFIPAITGIILAVAGGKVPSATNAGGGLSKYGYPIDPSRNLEHWMYAGLAIFSLYFIEVVVKGKVIETKVGTRFLPIITLFLYGCAYMISRVAVFPGSTPGT